MDTRWGVVVLIVVFLVFFGFSIHGLMDAWVGWDYKAAFQDGYKQGQIDYANGVVRWELSEQDNGERVWKEVGDVDMP